MEEAKQYFEKHYRTGSSSHWFDAAGKLKTGLTADDIFMARQPDWSRAFDKQISIGKAVQVPLKIGDLLVGVRNNKDVLPLESLHYLLMYKDALDSMHTEWVSLQPDSAWLYGNRTRYTGKISVRSWEGNLIKVFYYNKQGGITAYSHQPDGIRGQISRRSLVAPDPETCTMAWYYNDAGQLVCGWPDPICFDCDNPTDPPTYPTDPLNPGGGSGGTSGGDYNTSCNPDPNYTVPSYPPPTPNTQWQLPCGPVPVPEPDKYICTYELTHHDKEVFDQIDREDQENIFNAALKDCQGTKRPAGGASFSGTKEHYLIQLDFVSRNMLAETEFQIPMVGGGRGYADIANLANGNMFEIKPKNNTDAVTAGVAEVAGYIASANANCTDKLPTNTVWNPGTTYATRQWKTNQNNTYLQAEYLSPGMIVYSYVQTADPDPVTITVPQSIAEKFKHLIDRLKKNWDVADQIMAEFMADPSNAELVNYIKGAAIGAGVAIVVGSIIEDIATLGAGILDDFASFALAYRIIRFALAL